MDRFICNVAYLFVFGVFLLSFLEFGFETVRGIIS